MKKILILGAGTGGTILANIFTSRLDQKEWEVTVIDKELKHCYQPGFLFLPFKLYGYESEKDVTHPITRHLPREAKFVNANITLIDYQRNLVETSAGQFGYDWLIIGLGCHVEASEVDGLEEAMGKNAYTFYTLDGAMEMQKALDGFNEGRLVLNIADMPIKCPVAPIEYVFLADYYFNLRGIRDRVEISLVTPLTGAFTKPVATKALGKIAEEKNIKIAPNFAISEVDSEKRVITSFSGERIEYDLLASVPPNLGPDVIEESGIGNGMGYAVTDDHTLKLKKAHNVYVVGDSTNVPTSKAGSVAHFEAEIIAENLIREIGGKEPLPNYDGHSNCFIESGYHKALLFDFNYDTEPVHGVYPLPAIGPFALLKESRLNHWGKLAFKYIYWNLLLTGHLPGDPLLPVTMSVAGKDLAEIERSHLGHH
ncbi:MAG: NAD(P)/FAD-dependent oxidoreductase [Nitrospinae bacterium]|nr:NAD(P)/FAD-dependent oxidoreductase [Nitrospinota bacterium]